MPESQPADLALLRELNERIVLNLIRQEGPISRAEPAQRSNLSRSTVSGIIDAPIAADLDRETGVGNSRGRRRSIMFEFNNQPGYVIGVDRAAAMLAVLLTDLAATVRCCAYRPLDTAAGRLHPPGRRSDRDRSRGRALLRRGDLHHAQHDQPRPCCGKRLNCGRQLAI